MPGISRRLDPALVLRHETGLRAHLRQLVRDHHRIDDALQETWIRACEQPPDREEALGAWLRQVATREARSVLRRDQHRERLELERGPGEHGYSPVEVYERNQDSQRIRAAVSALSEPYRRAIVERFFAQLSPHEIAHRNRLPVETVRTRIKRGLAHLRVSLVG